MAILIDIALTFFTTYDNKDGVQVTSSKQIKMKYLKGWFTLHIGSWLPCFVLSFYNYDAVSVLTWVLTKSFFWGVSYKFCIYWIIFFLQSNIVALKRIN